MQNNQYVLHAARTCRARGSRPIDSYRIGAKFGPGAGAAAFFAVMQMKGCVKFQSAPSPDLSWRCSMLKSRPRTSIICHPRFVSGRLFVSEAVPHDRPFWAPLAKARRPPWRCISLIPRDVSKFRTLRIRSKRKHHYAAASMSRPCALPQPTPMASEWECKRMPSSLGAASSSSVQARNTFMNLYARKARCLSCVSFPSPGERLTTFSNPGT